MTRERLLKNLFRERFLITLVNGQAFDGLLDRFDSKYLEFVDAHQVTQDGKTPIDGRFYLPREQILFMQRPEAT